MKKAQRKPQSPPAAEQLLYNGRHLIGVVTWRAGKFRAADADNRKLGAFATRAAALQAVAGARNDGRAAQEKARDE